MALPLNKKHKLNLIFLLLTGIFLAANYAIEFSAPPYFPKPIYSLPDSQKDSLKIALGRLLFYDPILSKDNSISCASCHSSFNAFAHTDHALSHGINDSIGNRNAPALFNLAWQKNLMWDGSIRLLSMQALAPIHHPKEMGESLLTVLKKLQSKSLYKQAFYAVYQDSTIHTKNLLDAIEKFELSLVSFGAKYDRVKLGKDSFNTMEQRGYTLFKQHCNECHQEPLFFKNTFENNGLLLDSQLMDFGRFNITLQNSDSFKFKIPSLRNLAYTYPYMHDGRFKKLSDVLAHYQSNQRNYGQMTDKIRNGIHLNSFEKVELLAFLQTLNDKNFVLNPSHQFPKTFFRHSEGFKY
jgi:cytochrome c peroxidase